MQKSFCIGIHHSDLTELKELLATADAVVVGEMVQNRPHIDPHADPAYYFGKGKVQELKQAVTQTKAELIVADDELTARQVANLEKELELPVIDRTTVILDIFAVHAVSAEGKLQVELAQLQYNLAHMRGLWPHLERLGAGIGTRGPGETQIETDRRLARAQITKLKKKLKTMEKRRQVLQEPRKASPYPIVALAGYTNAGKSSLMNALTNADLKTSSQLFQTLDSTTRLVPRNGSSWLLGDTVGFIQKLPHPLIEAFKSTLEETRIADLILHVVDASEIEAEDASLPEISLQTLAAKVTTLTEENSRRPKLLLCDLGLAQHPEVSGYLAMVLTRDLGFDVLYEKNINSPQKFLTTLIQEGITGFILTNFSTGEHDQKIVQSLTQILTENDLQLPNLGLTEVIDPNTDLGLKQIYPHQEFTQNIVLADFIQQFLNNNNAEKNGDRVTNKIFQKITTVENILQEIQADQQPRLLVFNKIDLLSPENLVDLRAHYPEAVFVSAATSHGLEELYKKADHILESQMVHVNLLIPYQESSVLDTIYKTGHQLVRKDSPQGIKIQAYLPHILAGRLKTYQT